MRRILCFVSFMFLSIFVGLKIKQIDVIYASSTPLTIGIPAVLLKYLKHKPFIFEVRDQWPESVIELGLLKNRLLINALFWLERLIYKKSSGIITVSEGMAESIREIAKNKPVYSVPNGADLDLFRPEIDGSKIRQKHSWDKKLVFLHAGAMGKINGLEFVVDAANRLRDYDDILFVFIGQGFRKQYLQDKAKQLCLENVQILSSVAKTELPGYLAAADVILAVIGNYKIIEQHASLNKFYDGLSAGKPILLNYSGWQRRLLENNNAGLGCKLCDLSDFVGKILFFKNNTQNLSQMGLNSRVIAEKYFDRDSLAKKILGHLVSVADSKRTP